jgi:kynurenine formamidase
MAKFITFSPLFVLCFMFFNCKGPGKSDLKSKMLSFDHLEDLTYTLTEDFPYIHVHKLTFPFELKPMATLKKNGVNANTWIIHEHLGTHIDAPNHFQPDGISVDQIRPEDLIVSLFVIDIRDKASKNSDAELTVGDIKEFERLHGMITPHSCVMMLSGWGKYVKTPFTWDLMPREISTFLVFQLKRRSSLLKTEMLPELESM